MPHDIKIATCNIRCTVPADGANNWPNRKELCLDILRAQDADILCFQELTNAQEHDVTKALDGYASYGLPDEPMGDNSLNRIYYRENRFTMTASGGYWLSETPHVPGSRSWDSAYIRLANWVRLKDQETGNEFRVLNTHLDNVSQLAREGQAACIVDDSQAYPLAYSQLLTGDLNCDTSNHTISILKAGGWQDTYAAVHGKENPGHTAHEFLGPDFETGTGKIDWIFMRGNMQCRHAEIIADSINGKFPSDHYFVSAVVSIG